MQPSPLARLVADASALPGAPGAELVVPLAPRRGDRRGEKARAAAVPVHLLKLRVHELLAELARRVEATLPQTLAQAHGAWDQVDALRLLDKAVHDEHQSLLVASRRLQAHDSPEQRALGLEAQLTLDAAVDLVSLVERRLATLVRLRLRTATHATSTSESDVDHHVSETLLPAGRPFLDLGAALAETARRWA